LPLLLTRTKVLHSLKPRLTLALYRDAHSGRRVKTGRGVRARSIKPLKRGRPGLRQTRAAMSIQSWEGTGVKVCRGCARSPEDERHGLKRGLLGESAAESGIEETGRKDLSGLKTERCRVRRSTRSFRIRDQFHAAALVRGRERSWISAAVSRSMTFIGPPHLGQG